MLSLSKHLIRFRKRRGAATLTIEPHALYCVFAVFIRFRAFHSQTPFSFAARKRRVGYRFSFARYRRAAIVCFCFALGDSSTTALLRLLGMTCLFSFVILSLSKDLIRFLYSSCRAKSRHLIREACFLNPLCGGKRVIGDFSAPLRFGRNDNVAFLRSFFICHPEPREYRACRRIALYRHPRSPAFESIRHSKRSRRISSAKPVSRSPHTRACAGATPANAKAAARENGKFRVLARSLLFIYRFRGGDAARIESRRSFYFIKREPLFSPQLYNNI